MLIINMLSRNALRLYSLFNAAELSGIFFDLLPTGGGYFIR